MGFGCWWGPATAVEPLQGLERKIPMDGFYSSVGGEGQDVINDTSWAEESSSKLSLRVVTAALLLLLILSTLLGNTLVCVAVLKFRHLRSKVTNSFVVSLAVSDLLVAVLVMPWRAATDLVGFWPFGGAFCDVWVAFDIMCSTASILNLCIISLERYWAISSPFRHEGRMTQRVAFVMIGVAWLLSLLISFIPVQLQWHKDHRLLSQRQPGFNTSREEESCDSRLNRTYAISSSLISFYIPVAVMLVTYTRIFRAARRQIRRISSLERARGHTQSCHSPREASPKSSFKKETKVLKTLSVIMGVFVCCWLPFFVLNCVVPFCEPGELPCVGQSVFNTSVWLGWANSSLNPIIYAFNADFRRAFAALLGCGCPGSAVERLNLSDEPASYQHDTAFQRELATLSYPQLLPHAVLRVEDTEGSSERVPQVPSPSGDASPGGNVAILLVKVPPRTSNAFH